MISINQFLEILRISITHLFQQIHSSIHYTIPKFQLRIDSMSSQNNNLEANNGITRLSLLDPSSSLTSTLLSNPTGSRMPINEPLPNFSFDPTQDENLANVSIFILIISMLIYGVYSIFYSMTIKRDKATKKITVEELVANDSISPLPSASHSESPLGSPLRPSTPISLFRTSHCFFNTLPLVSSSSSSSSSPLSPATHFRPILPPSLSSTSSRPSGSPTTSSGSTHSTSFNTYTESTSNFNFGFDIVGNTAAERLMNLSKSLSYKHGNLHYISDEHTIEEDEENEVNEVDEMDPVKNSIKGDDGDDDDDDNKKHETSHTHEVGSDSETWDESNIAQEEDDLLIPLKNNFTPLVEKSTCGLIKTDFMSLPHDDDDDDDDDNKKHETSHTHEVGSNSETWDESNIAQEEDNLLTPVNDNLLTPVNNNLLTPLKNDFTPLVEKSTCGLIKTDFMSLPHDDDSVIKSGSLTAVSENQNDDGLHMLKKQFETEGNLGRKRQDYRITQPVYTEY
ncbi:hypothetical protein KGF56_002237 [Candida oxycetoniae]|uniref:Uncharacterized protein n=1 Tax=Candida oxycetoniae TaxID=497107 RepID=A0AAI9WY43_9ASCO|nr:uncharacterized protein KGF56_002237 [Candida oxycetoniae]KAI3404986.2 hypothetical protein KGF56_002237 [Candida oxycetoniae]